MINKKLQHIASADIKQAAAYLAIGGATALLELGIFQGLITLLGADVVIANIIALIISTATNFCLNGFVNFKMTSNPIIAAIKYLLLFGANTAFSTLTIKFFSDLGAIPLVVKIITMAMMTTWNFILYKKVIFK